MQKKKKKKKKKKKTYRIVNFAVRADYRVKIKENNKNKKIVEPCQRTKKKVWNMLVTVILIVYCVLRTVPKVWGRWLEELEIGRRIKNIQTTAFLNRPEYGEKSWRPEEIAVTQTPVKGHQLTKNLQGAKC